MDRPTMACRFNCSEGKDRTEHGKVQIFVSTCIWRLPGGRGLDQRPVAFP